MRTFETTAQLGKAIDEIVRREPRFAPVVNKHGLPSLRRMETGLKGLLRIVTDQLISLKAAEAIWSRVEQALHPFDPRLLSAQTEDSLMELGLTRGKARAFLGLAEAVRTGSLDFSVLHSQSDDEAFTILCKLKGIGPWTADIYLLSGMGRCDAWPTGDLALRVAAQDLFGFEGRPERKAMEALAENWRPWRSAGARLLWSHYRGLKGMEQASP